MIYQVNSWYELPYVKVQSPHTQKLYRLVVDSEPHADKEINTDYLHHHAQLQFLPNAFLSDFYANDSRKMQQRLSDFASVIFVAADFPTKNGKFRCLRTMPNISQLVEGRRMAFTPILEKLYSNHTLGTDKICPHKGAHLSGIKPDADGCVVCPYHRLRWNVTTGAMAPLSK